MAPRRRRRHAKKATARPAKRRAERSKGAGVLTAVVFWSVVAFLCASYLYLHSGSPAVFGRWLAAMLGALASGSPGP